MPIDKALSSSSTLLKYDVFDIKFYSTSFTKEIMKYFSYLNWIKVLADLPDAEVKLSNAKSKKKLSTYLEQSVGQTPSVTDAMLGTQLQLL